MSPEPTVIACPYAKSDWTPCCARDEHALLDGGLCVGCERPPDAMLRSLVLKYIASKDLLAAREKRMREVAEEIKRIASSGPAFNDFCHVAKEELNEWAAKLLEGLDAT